MGARGRLRMVAGGLAAYCPGCECYHIFESQRWQFNGDFDKPSFMPSMVVTVHDPEGEIPDERCHSFITDGVWRYLSDTTHPLRGEMVPLRSEIDP